MNDFMREFQKKGRALRQPCVVVHARQEGKQAVIEELIQRIVRSGERVVVASAGGHYSVRMDDPCDEWDPELLRPAAPAGEDVVRYRGWECGWEHQAEFWTGQGWAAYYGGADLGAPTLRAGTYKELLDLVDEYEEDES